MARYPASPRSPHPVAWIGIGLVHAFVAVGALLGGGAFVLRPDGSLIQADPAWLSQSPFPDYLLPGLILFFLVGVANAAATAVAFRRPVWAGWFTAAVGAILIGWLAGEFLFVPLHHWLQALYLGLGLFFVIAGLALGRGRVARSTSRRVSS